MKVDVFVKPLRKMTPDRGDRTYDHTKYLVTRTTPKGKTIKDFIYEFDHAWINLYKRTFFPTQAECISALPPIR